MLLRIKSELRYPVEFFWLLGLAFFLPLFEAPKNLCWAGYLLTWLYNRFQARDWGGPWERWDSLIATWIASGYLVAAFAGIRHEEWSAANDILRYGSVLWLLKRSHHGERALLAILGTIVASTLAALAWGYWTLYVSKTDTALTLNSVGHVNHSAIYLAIAFGVALSFALAYWPRMSTASRVLAGLVALVLGFSVFATNSRAAAASAVLFALLFTLALGARKGKGVWTSFLAVIFAATVLLAANPAILEKTANQTAGGQALAYRGDVWKNGMVEWRQFPLFGVGMGNFGRANLEQLQEWNKTQAWRIHPSAEGMMSHGHSLYVTALAERGLIGSAILFAVLFCWGAALMRAVPAVEDAPLEWTLFGAALAGWFIAVAVGIVNTTLHHEHGILSVLLLGLWLSRRVVPTLPDRAASRL